MLLGNWFGGVACLTVPSSRLSLYTERSPPIDLVKMAQPPVFSIAEAPIANKQRVESLIAAFESRHGAKPDFIARAPGRVNLIGEHIDYSGYAVLPMAIDQDFLLAVQVTDDNTLLLSNVDAKYTERSMPSWPVDIDSSKHDWINYFLAGYRGMMESTTTIPQGMRVMVDGNVPPGSGLSSSSAFVVCAALAVSYANKVLPSKLELATLCAKAEHYVGTEGGGMDQSISCLAEAGTAKLIEFNPIRATDVPLPKGAKFVIANSCVEANKYVTAGSCFNKRVVECRAAAMVLAKAKGLEDPMSYRKLGQFQEKLYAKIEEAIPAVNDHLHAEDYTQEEIATILGIDQDTLKTQVLSPSTADQTHFALHARAQHVFTEASRVWAFKAASDNATLGSLMSASHASCSKAYECSCPDLDELTEICLRAGAVGSRLTGAGWGGCTVSLVPSDKVDSFLKTVRQEYYDKRGIKDVDAALFATAPAQGAFICQG
eukprot:m.133767 g.133767  ORF g.133767 m.133767 type:complete len:487 (+) comp15955_c0_seq1:525-1985(+)